MNEISQKTLNYEKVKKSSLAGGSDFSPIALTLI